ncbi:MAG: aspartate aminotransferase family protein, partial [Actinomycetota bacterium]|nr:aspartate aminotransferase family protein [Actinomycetota bacterium]
PHLAQSAGNMFSIFFGDPPRQAVVDLTGAQDQQLYRFSAFFHAMLALGVWLPPSAYEAWFVNAALDQAAIDRLATALPRAARAAAAARPGARSDSGAAQ